MNDDIAPGKTGKFQTGFNLVSAALFLLLSVWVLIADLKLKAPILAQGSASLMIFFIVMSIWILLAIILAVIPKRFSLTIFGLFIIRSCYGWPVSLAMDSTTACRVTDWLLVLASAVYFVSIVLKKPQVSMRPWIRGRHSAVMAVCWVLSGILVIPMAFFGLSKAAEAIVGDYVKLTPKGVSFTERVFEKDGQRVHLVGMVHIGDASFYEVLKKQLSVPIEGKRLVLTEGVSDSKKLLPESFASGETYGRLAKRLGLEMQGRPGGEAMTEEQAEKEAVEWAGRGVHFENGDIDISQLSEGHLATLIQMLELVDEMSRGNFFPKMPEGMTEESIFLMMSEALIKERNDHLITVFKEKGADFAEIYIPWGAAHLAELETQILELGYVPAGETTRLGISFWR